MVDGKNRSSALDLHCLANPEWFSVMGVITHPAEGVRAFTTRFGN